MKAEEWRIEIGKAFPMTKKEMTLDSGSREIIIVVSFSPITVINNNVRNVVRTEEINFKFHWTDCKHFV